MKLERIVKTFYDSLEEGKIMGRKLPALAERGVSPGDRLQLLLGTDMQWVEMSGNGKMTTSCCPASCLPSLRTSTCNPTASLVSRWRRLAVQYRRMWRI